MSETAAVVIRESGEGTRLSPAANLALFQLGPSLDALFSPVIARPRAWPIQRLTLHPHM
jgi:hypothetical protein